MEEGLKRTAQDGVSLISSCFGSGLFYVSYLASKVYMKLFLTIEDENKVNNDDGW